MKAICSPIRSACHPVVRWRCFGVVSLLSFAGLLYMHLSFDDIFHDTIKQMMTLTEGSPVYDAWAAPKLPAILKIHLFSVTNVDQVLNEEGSKPRLKEFGPYVFEESMEKVNVTHHYNGTVSYTSRRFWHYQPHLSVGSLDDNVTTINFPLLAAVGAGKSMSGWEKWGLHQLIASTGPQPFVTKPVRQLLFDGYEETFLSMAAMFAPDNGGPPMDKFGWFYKRNGTSWAEGVKNTFTGETDPDLFGVINSFNGEGRTHYSGDCGVIRGSAEGFYPPFGSLARDNTGDSMPDQLDLYSHEACRSLPFTKLDGLIEQNGLKGRKYVMRESAFANATFNSDNKCFENNLPTGVHNATMCKAKNGVGAPIFLSFPHFYAADPTYVDQFTSDSDLAPKEELHQANMVLETTLSVPLELNFRLQLVVKVDPDSEVSCMRNLPSNLYLPTIWFEAHVSLPSEEASALQQVLNLPWTVRTASLVGVIVNAAFLLLATYCLAVRDWPKQQHHDDGSSLTAEEAAAAANKLSPTWRGGDGPVHHHPLDASLTAVNEDEVDSLLQIKVEKAAAAVDGGAK